VGKSKRRRRRQSESKAQLGEARESRFALNGETRQGRKITRGRVARGAELKKNEPGDGQSRILRGEERGALAERAAEVTLSENKSVVKTTNTAHMIGAGYEG